MENLSPEKSVEAETEVEISAEMHAAVVAAGDTKSKSEGTVGDRGRGRESGHYRDLVRGTSCTTHRYNE